MYNYLQIVKSVVLYQYNLCKQKENTMAESVTPSVTFDPDTMTLTARFDPYSKVAGLHAGINLMLPPYSVGVRLPAILAQY